MATHGRTRLGKDHLAIRLGIIANGNGRGASSPGDGDVLHVRAGDRTSAGLAHGDVIVGIVEVIAWRATRGAANDTTAQHDGQEYKKAYLHI